MQIQIMVIVIWKRLKTMPKLWNFLKGTLLVFLLISAIIFFLLKSPNVKQLQFEGKFIKINRNDYGIPHVKAPDFQSALYAWGYVTSEDRLFQLAFKRLVGHGRLSKYIGPKTINVDKMFRQLNMKHWAEKTAQKLQKENLTEFQNLQSYVKGINDHQRSLRFLPVDFLLIGLEWQPWTVSDLFLISKLLQWSQSQNMAEEYIRSSLLESMSEEEVGQILAFKQEHWQTMDFKTIVSDDELSPELQDLTIPLESKQFKAEKVEQLVELGIMDFLDSSRGSNSWVVSGAHTKSGLPILANDPHLDNAIPTEWHQIRVEYQHEGRTVFWEGGAMTGLPCMVGKTAYLSIGLTTIYADTQDLYKETIIDGEYYIGDRGFPLRTRTELIEVEGHEEPIRYRVQETHRGPLIKFINHFGTMYELKSCEQISLAWAGFHAEYDTITTYSHSAEVGNHPQILDFLENHGDFGPNMNFLYSTADGHIGYTAIGSLPVRKNVYSGNFVKDGSTTEHDWIGLIQKDRKLSLHDPKKGFIVTANNKPVSSKYQNGVFETSMYTARANRIQELIEDKISSGAKLDSADMKQMQLDTVDTICRANLPHLIRNLNLGAQYFEGFDCDFSKSSHQATIYEVFFHQLYSLATKQYNTEGKYSLMSSINYLNSLSHYIRCDGDSQTQKANMNQAMSATVQNLTAFFGTPSKEKWRWEVYHPDVISHRPFSGSEVLRHFYEKKSGGRGNINTVNVAKMNKLAYGDFTSNHRANIRTILSHSVGNEDTQSYWIVDTGVSEKFYSKHYDDQFKLFVKDQYLEIDFGAQPDSRPTSQQAQTQTEL